VPPPAGADLRLDTFSGAIGTLSPLTREKVETEKPRGQAVKAAGRTRSEFHDTFIHPFIYSLD